MTFLELLAPARNKDIGIAAIDCGADAVYIAGPAFGARKDASNSVQDIAELCAYAHKFGARIFVTVNTIIYDSELDDCYRLMLALQEAGADALIVQDPALLVLAARGGRDGTGQKITIPLHASTQCAIRTPDKAAALQEAGFSRIVPERQLSLEQIKAICRATACEVEVFVHGALCVCYSGECYLSEKLARRSANRGACIQACRSTYDLSDAGGKVLVRGKALLSLKDYHLIDHLEDLADAGACSFKIEGRLKNLSYVKNVVSAYSQAMDKLIAKRPGEYARASAGRSICGFRPVLDRTFNRGYTSLYIDGHKGRWAAADTPKNMGEPLGKVLSVKPLNNGNMEVKVDTSLSLSNGDGFAFVKGGAIFGFRGDICRGNTIICKRNKGLASGVFLYRNISAAFEKEVSSAPNKRVIDVAVEVNFAPLPDGGFVMAASARSADGRTVSLKSSYPDAPIATSPERMESLLRGQLSKMSGHYSFLCEKVGAEALPLLGAAALNQVRRSLAAELDRLDCCRVPLWNSGLKGDPEALRKYLDDCGQTPVYKANIANAISAAIYARPLSAYELTHPQNAELMRSKYCIRHELGLCRGKGAQQHGEGSLMLTGNGKPLELRFDCQNCEMTVIG